MIQTHESWQREVSPFLAGSNVRAYSLVQIVPGRSIFHVDVLLSNRESEKQEWASYVLTDLKEVVSLIQSPNVFKVQINVLIRTTGETTPSYELASVLEINELAGQEASEKLEYKCDNGKTYYSLTPLISFSTLSQARQLYRKE